MASLPRHKVGRILDDGAEAKFVEQKKSSADTYEKYLHSFDLFVEALINLGR